MKFNFGAHCTPGGIGYDSGFELWSVVYLNSGLRSGVVNAPIVRRFTRFRQPRIEA